MRRDGRIAVVLAFEAEPDARLVDRRQAPPWTGFEKLHGCLTALRKGIGERDGARLRLSWFLRMDAQVESTYGDAAWAAERYAGSLAASVAAGDDVGLHVHAFRWDDAAGGWIADHGNGDWVRHCVQTSAGAFERVFQRRCRSYRMGDRYLDDPTLALIEALGGRVDLSVEPGYAASPAIYFDQAHTGSLPDYRHAPRCAYRPSREDFRRVDSNGTRTISMLPLSTWRVHGALAVLRKAYVGLRTLRRVPLPDVLKHDRMITLGLALPPMLFRRTLADLLAAPASHLATIDRSHVGNEPEKLRRIEVNLRCLLSHPLAQRFAFVGPEQAVEISGGSEGSVPAGEAPASAR
jgi:hypothetical protein